MGHLSRFPNSNDIPRRASSKWGSKDPNCDDMAVLIKGGAKRCFPCGGVTLNKYITYKDDMPYCPECALK